MIVSGQTQLLGLLGWPVTHSYSPAMHNAAAAALGLDLLYLPLPVRPDDLPAAIRGLAALGFRGANVTVPHKQAVLPLLHHIDPAAQAIGAVNTIVVGEGEGTRQLADSGRRTLSGFNTDWSGFLADLATLAIEVSDRDCLVLGAGGSARAIAYALAHAGAHVHLFARRPQQAQQLINDLLPRLPHKQLHAHSWSELQQPAPTPSPPALIVNTTPVGMHPHTGASPWPAGVPLPASAFIYDLIYNPSETPLMRHARTAGCPTANGLGMLIHQGAAAFELWTGIRPDVELMRATVT